MRTLFQKISYFTLTFHAFLMLLAFECRATENVIPVPGKAGHFDFMAIDTKHDRLLAAHSGSGALTLLDLKQDKLLAEIPVGNVQGVAVDDDADTYVLGDADEHKIVFVSSVTLAPTGELQLSGPVDAIAFDPKNGFAYAGQDDGDLLWVVDVKGKKLVTKIPLPGIPESVVYDPGTDRIYQNIKNKDSVVVINPSTNKIEATWSTLPAKLPHGLAIDTQTKRLFIAGHNGILVGLDLKSNKVVAQAKISSGTDQIAFDSSENIIYCASNGTVDLVRVTAKGFELIPNKVRQAGVHTIAVDSNRHVAWVSFADKKKSYLEKIKKD